MNIIEGGITAPKGFLATGEHVGVKKVKKDMAIIYSEKPELCSDVFTKNLVKATPLWGCDKLVKAKQKNQAIVCNNGNTSDSIG